MQMSCIARTGLKASSKALVFTISSGIVKMNAAMFTYYKICKHLGCIM